MLLSTVSLSNSSKPVIDLLYQGIGSNLSWLSILLILLLVGIIVWWALVSNASFSEEDAPKADHDHEGHHEGEEISVEPDDLTKIEGIGPKISSVYQAAGIATFAQMAETEAEQLKQILNDAGIRLGNPATWPDQAKLAAAGDWESLEKLQDDLKGGRRE